MTGLDFKPPPASYSSYVDSMADPDYTSKAKDSSVYIPAGRTGTVQSFTEIINLKLRFAEFALHATMQGLKGEIAGRPKARAPTKEEIMPPPGSLPPPPHGAVPRSCRQDDHGEA